MTNNATVAGQLNVTSTGGTLSTAALNFTVTGNSWLGSGGTVTSTSGTLTFTGAVSSTGAIGSNSGNQLFSSTLQNNGTFRVGSGTATTTGALTNAGTINNNSGVIVANSDMNNTGTISGNAGSILLTGASAQNFGGSSNATNLNNLTINKSAGTVTLAGNVTSTGAFNLTSGTLAVGSNRFAATGTYANAGLVTIGSLGRIIHAVELVQFTNEARVLTSGYTTPDSMYIRINDPNRNLNASAIESFNITVTSTVAGGEDSEVITLTETGPATGIFQNIGMSTIATSATTTNNGIFEIAAGATVNAVYRDSFDSSDATAISVGVTFVKPAAPVAASSGGGGGGALSSSTGGSVATTSPTPKPVTTPVTPPLTTPKVPTPAPTPAPKPPVSPVAPIPTPVAAPVGQMKPAAVPAPITTVQAKDLTFSKLPTEGTVTQGAAVKFNYSYQNTTKTRIKVQIIREILTADGKTVRSVTGSATLKPSGSYAKQAVEAITLKLKPGTYIESIKVIDPKTKKVYGSGTFSFTVVAKAKAVPKVSGTPKTNPIKKINKTKKINKK